MIYAVKNCSKEIQYFLLKITTAVVKFIELPEHEEEKKNKEKFKIVSLKVKPGVEFTPEMVGKGQVMVCYNDINQ